MDARAWDSGFYRVVNYTIVHQDSRGTTVNCDLGKPRYLDLISIWISILTDDFRHLVNVASVF